MMARTMDRPMLMDDSLGIVVNGLEFTGTQVSFDRYNGEFVFYLKKGSPYTALINAALTQMEADGTTYRLRKKWMGE